MALTFRWIRHLAAAAAIIAAAACTAPLTLAKDDSATVLTGTSITASNPGEPGRFLVKRLTYGSGTDIRRPEFGTNVAIRTKTVDVSPFVSIPKTQQKHRKAFWGFDLKKAPINGRVWYPEGAGPFPLVLIVHGNHNPEDFSDPGYGYLGELLASRGFIMASVDENFINGLSEENDGRAWLLLKHLDAWKQFHTTTDGPLAGKVDMTRIALMGHSRGGEAAATAAAFNTLSYYPDDFKQPFNFHHGIKAVVAIAPVDGQYKPTGQFTPLENVHYFIMHGSHDGDVSTAVGLRQYERLTFSGDQPWFKAMVFMYRANHGQWNTVWGNKDNGPRSGRSLDLRGLIDPEDQRRFAKVMIGGFLEATLHGAREYVDMFRDHRAAGGWLPKTMYTTRFQENGYRPLVEYGEDVDLTTGSTPGVAVAGAHLSTWQEKAVPFRGRGNDSQNHNGAWVGWNNALQPAPDAPENAPTVMGPPAAYAVTLPVTLAADWRVGPTSVITLSLAATDTKPGPRALEQKAEDDEKPAAKKTPAARKPTAKKPAPKKKEEPDKTPVDLTVEVTDAAGQVASVTLSRYGIARHPLEANIYRRRGRDSARFTNNYELVPQTFLLPLADFAAANRDFDPASITRVRLLFDKTNAGTVIVDHIGITTPVRALVR